MYIYLDFRFDNLIQIELRILRLRFAILLDEELYFYEKELIGETARKQNKKVSI